MQIRRKTRSSKSEIEETEPQQDVSKRDNENTTKIIQKTGIIQTELSDSVLKALDDTMVETNDSMDSTVTNSFLDSTYYTSESHDDSITELKLVGQSKQLSESNNETEVDKTSTIKHSEEIYQDTDDSKITCIESCTDKNTSSSIRLKYVHVMVSHQVCRHQKHWRSRSMDMCLL